jgi:phenylacetate-coenzyme A ligase PaaK-like adenylate-forming protein
MAKECVTCIVGMPTQVSELARSSGEAYGKLAGNMRSVLLSAEYVPEETCDLIRHAWNCKVFEHYGMTEMGLGGAVSCFMLEGYHPREADLYFEIIDPKTGEVLPDGETGEVVFTTLTRKGMPFIRYRTGDTSRWLTEPCGCGSVLKRLDKAGDRKLKKSVYSRTAEQLSQLSD